MAAIILTTEREPFAVRYIRFLRKFKAPQPLAGSSGGYSGGGHSYNAKVDPFGGWASTAATGFYKQHPMHKDTLKAADVSFKELVVGSPLLRWAEPNLKSRPGGGHGYPALAERAPGGVGSKAKAAAVSASPQKTGMDLRQRISKSRAHEYMYAGLIKPEAAAKLDECVARAAERAGVLHPWHLVHP